MNSGSRPAAAALLYRIKKGVEIGHEHFALRPHEVAEAYGTWTKTEILKHLGPGWEARAEEKELIVSRTVSKEKAIRQLDQLLNELAPA